MSDRYQYRIKVNGATGPILNAYPTQQWEQVALVHDQRGGEAAFQRRLITTPDILPGLTDRTGYIQLGDVVVCPWEIIARFNPPA